MNLIGEHTDYNRGFVFPIALEMSCYVAIAPAGHNDLRVYSVDWDDEFSIPVDSLPSARPRKDWTDYVVGVAHELAKAAVSAFRLLTFGSEANVPAGSGLSSSAALEVSTAFALLGERSMDPLEMARLAQRAESKFVGMPCGIMDQYASVFGQAHSAIQIDCRSLVHKYIPLPENLRIIAVNSLVKHELGTSAYRDRVAECQQAVAAIQQFDPAVQTLRDVSPSFFEEIAEKHPARAPAPRAPRHLRQRSRPATRRRSPRQRSYGNGQAFCGLAPQHAVRL